MSLKFNFTVEKLKECAKRNRQPENLHAALIKLLPKYDIDTVDRVAAFLAQCGHESLDFTVLRENLNYSARGLRITFKKYFKDDMTALRYERKPEMIANRVYANRMGNGNEASGDGWKFRGRGAIQLTGKENYSNFAKSINMSIDETIKHLETLEGALESACWFWKKNGLNEIADRKDIVLMTRRINGGNIGLEDRRKHYEHNLKVLNND
jgi:putative chitinase